MSKRTKYKVSEKMRRRGNNRTENNLEHPIAQRQVMKVLNGMERLPKSN